MKIEKDYIIRRIRRGEANKLNEIFETASYFDGFFSKHNEWLKRAIADINSNNRIAFGAYKNFVYNNQSKNDVLVGAVILKRGEFSYQMELKYLIANKKPFSEYANLDESVINEKVKDLKIQILRKVIKFCENRNYTRIETELPSNSHEEISIFLECGFNILSIREKYGIGKYVYVIERKLGLTYYGDPFDIIKMIIWCIKRTFHDESHISTAAVFYKETSILLQKITIDVKHTTYPLDIKNIFDFKIQINVIEFPENISDKDLSYFNHSFEDDVDIRYLITYDCYSNLKEKKDDNREYDDQYRKIKYFSKDDLLKYVGGMESSLKIPFSENEVGGVVAVIDSEYISKIHSGYGKEYIYFLLSDIGNYLIDYDDDDKNSLIAFYSTSRMGGLDKNGSGIWALGRVLQIHKETYDYAYNYFPKKIKRLMNEEDFQFYRTYSEYDLVVVVKFKVIGVFNKPINISDYKTNDKILRYIESELIEENSSAVYFDNSFKEFLESSLEDENLLLNPLKTQIQKNDSIMDNKKIDWWGLALETLKGIPHVGPILFNGYIKYRQDKNQQNRYDDINDKLEVLRQSNQEFKNESISKLIEIDEKMQLVFSRLSTNILNSLLKEYKGGDIMVNTEEIRYKLHLSEFPFPVGKSLLKKELVVLFDSELGIKEFRNVLSISDYKHSRVENDVENELYQFCDNLVGKDTTKLEIVFSALSERRPSSLILIECVQYCKLQLMNV